MKRLIAIGDIHGRLDRLNSLLELIRPDGDKIVFLGDLIDRGPDSRGVVDAIVSLAGGNEVVALFGNHEEMLLSSMVSTSSYRSWLMHGGRETLQSYSVTPPHHAMSAFDRTLLPPDHLLFYSRMPEWHESDGYLFVHASYRHDVPPAAFGSDVLRWNKFNRSAPPHCSGAKVVCGHSVQREPFIGRHQLCIDTGCGLPHGKLTGIDLSSQPYRIWQA